MIKQIQMTEDQLRSQDDGRVLNVAFFPDGKCMVVKNTYPYRAQNIPPEQGRILVKNMKLVKPSHHKQPGMDFYAS